MRARGLTAGGRQICHSDRDRVQNLLREKYMGGKGETERNDTQYTHTHTHREREREREGKIVEADNTQHICSTTSHCR